MLYEMIAVVRPGHPQEVKELAKKAGLLIIQNGGVVRGITNWGPFLLTSPVQKNQARYDHGVHFILRFDAHPTAQEYVRKTIAIDPRMIRCGVVKMGSQLARTSTIKGMAEWRRQKDSLGGMDAGMSLFMRSRQ